MAPTPEPRDLVAELRRVDEACANLRPGRDDIVERLLSGDTDELVRQSARRLRRDRVRRGLALTVPMLVVGLGAFGMVRLSGHGDEAPVVAPGGVSVAVVAAPVPTTVAAAPASAEAAMMPTSSSPSALAVVESSVTSSVTSSAPAVAPLRLPRARAVSRRIEQGPQGAVSSFDDTLLTARLQLPTVALNARPEALGVPVDAVAATSQAPLSAGDIDDALRTARRLAQAGHLVEAAEVLEAQLLAREPSSRVVDVVSLERASLLYRAGRQLEACAALVEHQRRFKDSDRAVAVRTSLVRWDCR
jgi:hypothetical protein